MTTYNTYQEAKIANPDCDIAEVTEKAILEFGEKHVFEALVKSSEWEDGYAFVKNCYKSPRIKDGYWKLCSPADYCMTVEKFLVDECKFNGGDSYLDWKGRVRVIGSTGFTKDACNDIRNIANADQAFILRAAALEEKKPRTKVEYVKCEFVTKWEHVKLMEDTGESLFFLPNDEFIEVMTPESAIKKLRKGHELYRRIETEITERDEFIEFVESKCSELNVDGEWSFSCIAAELFDSGRVKLLESGHEEQETTN